jgi:hypothetical protein
MESYDLYLDPPGINPVTGRFRKGMIPFNKGLKWTDYMDTRNAKKALKCLEKGRIKGNKHLAGSNRIAIVRIDDGKLTAYNSAAEAAKILKQQGLRISAHNIRIVCNGKGEKTRWAYHYRKTAGGFRWFNASDVEKYKGLLSDNSL